MKRTRAGQYVAGAVGAVMVLATLVTFPRDARGQDDAVLPAITFVIRGLRSNRGHVRGGLYASRDTFTRSGHETAICVVPIVNGIARCRLDAVPAGRYALGVMHDEDDDGLYDTGFLGIPEEGYGFSRDASGGLGPPSFENAAFDYDGRSQRSLALTIRYGI